VISAELHQLLYTFHHLQRFVLSSPYDARRSVAFNPCLIRNGLSNPASTFRKLTLTAKGRTKSFMGSLFEFRVLEEIDMDWGFLGPVWGRDIGVKRLPWLPASLRRVKLYDEDNHEILDYIPLVQKAMSSKLSDIEHLQELGFSAPSVDILRM